MLVAPTTVHTFVLCVVPDPDFPELAEYRLERRQAGKRQATPLHIVSARGQHRSATMFVNGLEMVLVHRDGTVVTAFSEASNGGITSTLALGVFFRASSVPFGCRLA